jgi:hypothetical protein
MKGREWDGNAEIRDKAEKFLLGNDYDQDAANRFQRWVVDERFDNQFIELDRHTSDIHKKDIKRGISTCGGLAHVGCLTQFIVSLVYIVECKNGLKAADIATTKVNRPGRNHRAAGT